MPSFLSIPKLSAPLTKAIRTSEGVIVWVSNLVLGAGALVDPSKLPPKEAAIVLGVLNVAHIISRTTLKAVALQQGAGIGAPVPFDPVPSAAAGELDQVIAEGVQLAGTLTEKPPTAAKPDGFTQAAPGPAAFAGAAQPQGVVETPPAAAPPATPPAGFGG